MRGIKGFMGVVVTTYWALNMKLLASMQIYLSIRKKQKDNADLCGSGVVLRPSKETLQNSAMRTYVEEGSSCDLLEKHERRSSGGSHSLSLCSLAALRSRVATCELRPAMTQLLLAYSASARNQAHDLDSCAQVLRVT
eukprot:3496487-Pyramimonas_sp.AAC.1